MQPPCTRRPFDSLALFSIALAACITIQAAVLVTYDMQETGGVAIRHQRTFMSASQRAIALVIQPV